jgi:fatty acid desaturase
VLNVFAGHLASVFAFIPFASWRRIHGLHHVWTGWQDKDPTTASLTPRHRGGLTRAIVDIAWRCWLPLFSVVYRVGN